MNMKTANNESALNIEQEKKNKEGYETKIPSGRNLVMKDGKLTVGEVLYVARYFIPIINTIGWLIIFTLGAEGGFFESISLVFIGIGLISALTVCPSKLLMLPVKWSVRGFYICRSFIPVYGAADLCAAIFGTSIGFLLGVFVILGVPALFTVKKFFDDSSFE